MDDRPLALVGVSLAEVVMPGSDMALLARDVVRHGRGRPLADQQASWDLSAFVVAGGILSLGYRMWKRGPSRVALMLAGLTITIAVPVGALVALGVRA